MNIIKANAEYTGGGIYRYTAQTDEGTWLIGDTLWDWVLEVDADPDETEDSWYGDWCEAHEVMNYTDEDFKRLLNEMIYWILANRPDGNYDTREIERDLEEGSR